MTAQLAPRQTRQPASLRLQAVPKPAKRMATIPFVSFVALLLGLAMVGMLILTTALQDQAFEVQSRRREANTLANQLSALESELAASRSVGGLATAAQKLGMRPNPGAAQLQLRDGKVVGTAKPVSGDEIPGVRHLTPEQAQAQIAALDRAEAARLAKEKAARRLAAEKKAAEKAEREAAAAAKPISVPAKPQDR